MHTIHSSLLRISAAAPLGLLLSLGACTQYETPDAGAPDASVASVPDSGVVDAGAPDTGIPDAGRPDTGIPDASRPDTWMPPPTPREAARTYFVANIIPIMSLETQNCFSCHSGELAATNQINWLSHVTAGGVPDAYESARSYRAQSSLLTGDLLYNMYEPGQSLILLKGQHASLAGPAFGTTGSHLTRFIRWVELEAEAARSEGSFDAGPPLVPDAGPQGSSSSTSGPAPSSSAGGSGPVSSAGSSVMTATSDPGTTSSEGGSSAQPPSSAAPVSSSSVVTASSAAPPDAGSVDANLPDPPLPDAGYVPPVGDPNGGMFHHPIEPVLPPDQVLSLLAGEGPPDFALRVHGCSKLSYDSMGQFLTSRGIDLASTADGSAGSIYSEKAQALGAPDFSKNEPESLQLSTGGAAKLFDVFLQGSAEIVANMSARADCMDPDNTGGSVANQARLFNDSACAANQVGCCLESGFTCLLGQPVTEDHLAYCDRIVATTLGNTGMSVDPQLGKQVAVAAMLSGSYICE